MGNYNMQYQSYYNSLAKNQKGRNGFSMESSKKGTRANGFIKIITRQLIGVLILFIFVLICKIIVTPQTQYVYKYSKGLISKEYSYELLINKAKTIKFEDVEMITKKVMEKMKNTISKGNTVNDTDFKAGKL